MANRVKTAQGLIVLMPSLSDLGIRVAVILTLSHPQGQSQTPHFDPKVLMATDEAISEESRLVLFIWLWWGHQNFVDDITWAWWRNQMKTFSALLAICAGNSPVPGEFPTQRPVTRSFDVYFDLRPNKWLSKQSWGWWFVTLSCSLWRHRNGSWGKLCYINTLG